MNGAAALSLVELEPSSVPTNPTEAAPGSKPGVEIEIEIGEATAAAACVIAAALTEYQDGALRPETKMASGESIAKMFRLQEETLGKIDFPTVARAESKRILRGYFPAEFYQHHGEGAGEVTMDVFIDGALEILGKVTALERAWAN